MKKKERGFEELLCHSMRKSSPPLQADERGKGAGKGIALLAVPVGEGGKILQ